MKLVYNLGLALLLLGLPTVVATAAGKGEFTKTIKKEFEISPDGTTDITNKYGKVALKTWDRNRVKITVSIVVRAGSESEAQEVFDRIDVAFSNSPSLVKAQTNIESRKGRKWWNWNDDDKSDYSINYEVFLPAGNNVVVNNKYGDVYVAELGGRADLNVKYGNFKADGFGGDAEIDLGYGNGSLERANNLNLDIKYGKFQCENANRVDILSKYSKIRMEQAGQVNCESKYDDYNLGEVESFRNTGKYDNFDIRSAQSVVVRTKYTEIDIDEVGGALELEMEYGNAAIERLANGFEEVNLNGRYTDFRLYVEDGAAFRMDAAAEHAGIRYPSGMTITYEKESGDSREVRGYRGSDSAPSVIRARLTYGGLRVSQ